MNVVGKPWADHLNEERSKLLTSRLTRTEHSIESQGLYETFRHRRTHRPIRLLRRVSPVKEQHNPAS
jgi:hypothetical protein